MRQMSSSSNRPMMISVYFMLTCVKTIKTGVLFLSYDFCRRWKWYLVIIIDQLFNCHYMVCYLYHSFHEKSILECKIWDNKLTSHAAWNDLKKWNTSIHNLLGIPFLFIHKLRDRVPYYRFCFSMYSAPNLM